MANLSIYQNFLKPVRSAQEYANDEVTREQNLLGLQDSQIKIANARQAQADEVATRQAFAAGAGDIGATARSLSAAGAYKPAMALIEQQRKIDADKALIGEREAQAGRHRTETVKTQQGIDDARKMQFASELANAPTREHALAFIEQNKDAPGVDANAAAAVKAAFAAADTPEKLEKLQLSILRKAMSPKDQLAATKPVIGPAMQGGSTVTVPVFDQQTGRVIPGAGASQAVTVSPNTAANNAALAPLRSAQAQQALTGAQGVAARTNYETNTTIPVPGVSSAPAPQGQTGTTLDVNNPGGLRPVGASTGFQRFDTPEAGLQAVTQNLRAYGQKGINTIEKIVSTWAPSNENDTKAYIAHVSRMLGIPANQPLDMSNPYVLQGLTTAIITKEQGPRLFAQPQQQNLPSTQKARDALISDKAKGGEFGSPQEVTGPDGKPMLVVQNKRTGFMHDANNLQPVAVAGPKVDTATSKELTSINQQRATIDGALKAVKESPDAFSFSRGVATRLGPTAETIAGRSDTPAQSQARSYVFNIVSKVINERAGAAQSAQELARLRGFLPAEQDNAQQITNKLNGFKQFLDDLEKGTTGIRGATAKPEGDKPQGPKVGERRIISGMDAEWDGKGWKKVSK